MASADPTQPFSVGGIRNFGWVEPGLLARGEQPPLENGTFQSLRELGIRAVVSLRPDREPPSQASPHPWPEYRVAEERAVVEAAGLRFSHAPLEDFSAPSPADVAAVLRVLDAELARSPAVYVHCRAGAGRAALITSAWAVSRGQSGDRAAELYERFMEHLARSRGLSDVDRLVLYERVGQPYVWWALREIVRALGSPVTRDLEHGLPARRPPRSDGWEAAYDVALAPWRRSVQGPA